MDRQNANVYFPVESLTGLGHFNRTGKLVREMVKNGFDVTVASGTFVDPQRFFAGAAIKDIPPYVFKSGKDSYYTLDADGKRTIIKDYNETARKLERASRHVGEIQNSRPDVFVSEFWPFDRENLDHEMQAMLQALPKALRLVSVRDVLHAPETTLAAEDRKNEKPLREEWTINTINKNYDAVLVHGDPNFIPLTDTFPQADKIQKEIIYTGYVIDDLPKRQPLTDTAPVLVSCGSGKAGKDMMLSMLTAWKKLLDMRGQDPRAEMMTSRPLHLVCGPRFPADAYQEVSEWAGHLSQKYGAQIIVDKYRPDFTAMLAQAAFSVSLAGYNTTLETLAIGTPALFVPNYEMDDFRPKMMSEQVYRLERLQQRGLATHIHPNDVRNSAVFAERLMHEFATQTQKPPAQGLNVSGAASTVRIVSELLKNHKKSVSGLAP